MVCLNFLSISHARFVTPHLWLDAVCQSWENYCCYLLKYYFCPFVFFLSGMPMMHTRPSRYYVSCFPCFFFFPLCTWDRFFCPNFGYLSLLGMNNLLLNQPLGLFTFLFLTERTSNTWMSGSGRGKGRERESQAGSLLSVEPDTGLISWPWSHDPEIMTWADIKRWIFNQLNPSDTPNPPTGFLT